MASRIRRFLEYLAMQEDPGEVRLVLLSDAARAIDCPVEEAQRLSCRMLRRRLISVINRDPATWYVALTPEGRRAALRGRGSAA
ncbi:MAG: hypothetical protein GX649_03165 [Chloroflexi bacterium]|nr:hypothetical protein [Chloroflexota bacterium]